MSPAFWAKEQFVVVSGLASSKRVKKPFDGLDNILLLSWIQRKLACSDYQLFVWHYWDLRPPNIILDEYDNLIGYVTVV